MSERRLADLDVALLRALRGTKETNLRGLAAAVGVPRSNFGRALSHRLEEPVEQLVRDGLVDERGGRYRISDRGRRCLARLAVDE